MCIVFDVWFVRFYTGFVCYVSCLCGVYTVCVFFLWWSVVFLMCHVSVFECFWVSLCVYVVIFSVCVIFVSFVFCRYDFVGFLRVRFVRCVKC